MNNFFFIISISGVFYCMFLSAQSSEESKMQSPNCWLKKSIAWILIITGIVIYISSLYLYTDSFIKRDAETNRIKELINKNNATFIKVVDNDNIRKEQSVKTEYESYYKELCSNLDKNVTNETIFSEAFERITRKGGLNNNKTNVQIPISEYYNEQYQVIKKRGISLDEKIRFLAMFTTIADVYGVNSAVSWLDTKVRETIDINSTSCDIPSYVKIVDLTTEGKKELLESSYLSDKELKQNIENKERFGVYENIIKSCVLLSFIFIGWGIYLKNFKKSQRPLWKKAGKFFVYVLVTSAYLSVPDNLIFTVSVVISLALFYWAYSEIKDKNKEKTIANTEFEEDTTEQYIQSQKTNIKGFFIKLLTSVILVFIFVVLILIIAETNYGEFIFFYIPYYLIFCVYYFYLIWRNKKVKGEDILLLPLLNILGIYKKFIDEYSLRKKLLQSTLPILIISILAPLLALFLEVNRSYESAPYGLVLPIVAWVIFFIYTYCSEWLNSSSNNK